VPWRGPDYPGEFPTLGWLWIEWIEEHCVVPDRYAAGEPFKLAEWQARHLLWQGRLRPDAVFDPDKPAAPFTYNGSLMVYPQKMGKGPFSAARALLHGVGPCLFAGWDADGEPVGMPRPSAHVQIAATAEDQTKNIWRALKPMIEIGPLAAVINDTGLERMNLPGNGIIETVTSKALTRLGARISYVEMDQPESWNAVNGGEKLADVLQRNLAGTGGRWAATGNAHDPTEGSVQQTWIERPTPDVYIDYPEPLAGSWGNKRERRRILKHAYAGSPWVDLDRIEADCVRLEAKGDPGQAERFFGNRVVAGSAKAFDVEAYRDLAKLDYRIARRSKVVLSFDGALVQDTTVLMATEIATGHQVVVAMWARPLNLRDEDPWSVPIDELNEAVDWAFKYFDVWRFYGDPPHYRDDLNRWAGQYGAARVVEFWTSRRKDMAYAIREFLTDMREGVMSHGPLDDSPEAAANHEQLQVHIGNAVRWPTKIKDEETGLFLWLIGKDGTKSVRKIDAAMTAVIGWRGKGDGLRAGVNNTPQYGYATFG